MVDEQTARRMTSYDILRSGRQPMDPTSVLECEKNFAAHFQPQPESDDVHALVIVCNKDEWLTLRVAVFEEDRWNEAVHLKMDVKRTDSVDQLMSSIYKVFIESQKYSVLLWRLYLAQDSDGNWLTIETVDPMTSRELVQSGRRRMPSGGRLDWAELFGPGTTQPRDYRIHVLAISSERRQELDDVLVSVECAIVTAYQLARCIPPTRLTVDVHPSACVEDLQAAIVYEIGNEPPLAKEEWRLYLAQAEDGSRLDRDSILRMKIGQVECDHRKPLASHALLASDECFGNAALHEQDSRTRILVDTQAGKARPSPEETLQSILSTASSTQRLPGNLGEADIDHWCDADCGSMKDIARLAAIFPVLPRFYYVRKEILIVWNVFKALFLSRFDAAASTTTTSWSDEKELVLAGSPVVGKSSFLMLLCAYVAVKFRCRAVLYQRHEDASSSVWYLAGDEGTMYLWKDLSLHSAWNEELLRARVDELASTARSARGNVWVCTDGFSQHETRTQSQCLEIDLRILPFPRYEVRYKSWATVRTCLVACWREADLTALGRMRGMTDDECQARYHVSGGIPAWFLGDIEQAKRTIRRAVERLLSVNERDIAPRMCQSTCDEIFTLTFPVDATDEQFRTQLRWRHEVTSAFAQKLVPEGFHFRWF